MKTLYITFRYVPDGGPKDNLVGYYSPPDPPKVELYVSPLRFRELIKDTYLIGYNLSPLFAYYGIRKIKDYTTDFEDLYLLARYYEGFKLSQHNHTLPLSSVLEQNQIEPIVNPPFDYKVAPTKLKANSIKEIKDELYALEKLHQKFNINLPPYKKLEKKAFEIIVDMMGEGLHIDEYQVKQLVQSIEQQLVDLQSTFRRITGQLGVNLRAPHQVAQALNLPSVNTSKKDLLFMLYNETDENRKEAIKTLLEFRKLEKQRQFLEQYLNYYLSKGKLTGIFLTTGAPSGRMSCYDINLQQIPRNLRFILRPPRGKWLVKLDFPQIELRLATLFYAKTFQDLFRDGIDLHTYTAKFIFNTEDVTKGQRQVAKAINFGLLYGMFEATLIEHIFVNTGILLSRTEAEYFRNSWLTLYPDVAREHQLVLTSLRHQGYYKDKTIFKRPYTTNSFNKALNYKIQGSGADLLKATILFAYEEGVRFCNLIHDEMIAIAGSEEHAQEVAQKLILATQKAWKLCVEEARKRASHKVEHIPLPLEYTIIDENGVSTEYTTAG